MQVWSNSWQTLEKFTFSVPNFSVFFHFDDSEYLKNRDRILTSYGKTTKWCFLKTSHSPLCDSISPPLSVVLLSVNLWIMFGLSLGSQHSRELLCCPRLAEFCMVMQFCREPQPPTASDEHYKCFLYSPEGQMTTLEHFSYPRDVDDLHIFILVKLCLLRPPCKTQS